MQYSFQPNDLRDFRLLPPVQDQFIPDMMVLAADAAQGGDCDFAVSMGYITDGNLVVRSFYIKSSSYSAAATRSPSLESPYTARRACAVSMAC